MVETVTDFFASKQTRINYSVGMSDAGIWSSQENSPGINFSPSKIRVLKDAFVGKGNAFAISEGAIPHIIHQKALITAA